MTLSQGKGGYSMRRSVEFAGFVVAVLVGCWIATTIIDVRLTHGDALADALLFGVVSLGSLTCVILGNLAAQQE